MPTIASYVVDGESRVDIEIDPALVPDGYYEAGAFDRLTERLLSMGAALDPVMVMLDSMLTEFRKTAQQAQEIELSLGLKLGLEGNIVVAKSSAEANFEIRLKYRLSP